MRRLLPALFVVLAFVLVAGFFLQRPADYIHLAKTGAFASLASSNIFFFLESNYFNPAVPTLPLLHTWPVAAVEQFCIILPLVIVLLRKARPVLVLTALAGLAAASFVWSNWYLAVSQTGGFYLFPSRAWELLAGSALAYLPRLKINPLLAGAAGLGGLAMILVAVAAYNDHMYFPDKKALLPVVGAMEVIYFSSSGDEVVAKLLAWKPLTFIGTISYPLFLWHWPLIAFYKYLGLYDGSLPPKLLLMATTFGLAVASWRFIELPFQRHAPQKRLLKPVLVGLSASVAAAALYGAVVIMDGLPGRNVEAVLALQTAG